MGKALVLDAAAQNGVNSSVSTWWLQRLVAGLCSLALHRTEARGLREHGDGLKLLWRDGLME